MIYVHEEALSDTLATLSEHPADGLRLLKLLQQDFAEAQDKVLAHMTGGHSLKEYLQRVGDDETYTEQLEALSKLIAIHRQNPFTGMSVDFWGAPSGYKPYHYIFEGLEERGHRVAMLIFNPQELSLLRKVNPPQQGGITWEPRARYLKKGILGALWGATLIVSRDVPPGQMWFAASPEEIFPAVAPETNDPEVTCVETPAGLFMASAISIFTRSQQSEGPDK